uniref:Spore coat assembly protein exsA n=1 Tax=Anthurium amnicola TaxID=1678845 RepID=A0A1D1Y374_9ARAE
MAASKFKRSPSAAAMAMADAASWCCALLLVGLVLLSSLREAAQGGGGEVRGRAFAGRACDEIYVVGEGETLHTISDKCGDPFIVEENPHIHDPDDVFPGLVIKITPSKSIRHK